MAYQDNSQTFISGRGLSFPISWTYSNPPCVISDTTDELGEEQHKSWQMRLMPKNYLRYKGGIF